MAFGDTFVINVDVSMQIILSTNFVGPCHEQSLDNIFSSFLEILGIYMEMVLSRTRIRTIILFTHFNQFADDYVSPEQTSHSYSFYILFITKCLLWALLQFLIKYVFGVFTHQVFKINIKNYTFKG